MRLSIPNGLVYILALMGLFTINDQLEAQTQKSDWVFTTEQPSNDSALLMGKLPEKYILSNIDVVSYKAKLKDSKSSIWLPDPSGQLSDFVIVETKVMSDDIAHLYSIKTFKGYMKNDPSIQLACDVSEGGFNATVYNGSETYFIQPLERNSQKHIIFYKSKFKADKLRCSSGDHVHQAAQAALSGKSINPTAKRTFDLALVAAGEFSQQFGGMPYSATNVLNALASGVNMINPIFLRDMGVEFNLVTTAAMVFQNPATDPFDPNMELDMIEQCNEVCFSTLGNAGYDIGHLVIWDQLGGLAYLGVVCEDFAKGYGYSGNNNSLTTLWIDYVCHEIGHQFGMNHNFAAKECSNSVTDQRFEPGEGSSIMCYAGVCDPVVQVAPATIPFFHYANIDRVQIYNDYQLTCADIDPSGNSADPRVEANSDLIIPTNTPFILVGSAEDGNDPTANLTYDWEQYDGSGAQTIGLPNCASLDQPLFKYVSPTTDAFRNFPDYEEVLLGNNTGVDYEKLPCTSRNMKFSLAVRDNNLSFGRMTHDTMNVSVVNTGPFEMSTPNGGETFNGGMMSLINWSVNGTNTHCPTIDILISYDGGLSYEVLANSIANNGNASIIIPNIATSTARLLIRCDVQGGYRTTSTFYDVMDDDFSIVASMDITWYADTDGDSYGDPNNTIVATTQPMGYVLDNTDCDDTNVAVNPAATEICNGIDDDCDGLIDANDPSVVGSGTWYADADGDGFGDLLNSLVACTQPMGYVMDNTDCDDGNVTVNPGATEICNGIDDDCDGLIDMNDPSLTGTAVWFLDADNDGYGDQTMSVTTCTPPAGYVSDSNDCDDSDGNVNPGATEICNGIDDDCDGLIDANDPSVMGTVTWFLDADGDGYGNFMNSITSCTAPVGYVSDSNDCDDNNFNVNPGATEICNNIDDDCDGLIDGNDPSLVGSTTVYYADADGDGYGDVSSNIQACTQPFGYVTNSNDCDDNNFNINPGATEICNGIDDDCDGLVDANDPSLVGSNTWYGDFDGDGYGNFNITLEACSQPAGYVANSSDCNDNNFNINPGAQEICNGTDDDCDNLVDDNDPSLTGTSTWYADNDGDGYGNPLMAIITCTQPTGYVNNNSDCDDNNQNVSPSAQEVCNGIDDDCDGLIDDNDPSLSGTNTWYADNDLDGYGDPNMSIVSCSQPVGYVINNTDCNDSNSALNPGVQEVCNNIDDDCDGLIDDADPDLVATTVWYADNDNDSYGDPFVTLIDCNQPVGYVSNNLDCNDANSALNPGAQEICNGIDDDCDGLIDGADPNVSGTIIWFADNDADGFGDAQNTISSCTQPLGYVSDNSDCNDVNQLVFPGAIEVCNGIDDDCDGLIDGADPDVGGDATWYQDVDADGYGNPDMTFVSCTQPAGYVLLGNDCDDNNSTINPGVQEVCNGYDDNCDGLIDGADPTVAASFYYLDSDGDGFGNPNNSILECTQPAGYVINNTDCDDTNNQVFPGATEICNNGIDDDCDGLIDAADPDVTNSTWFADADGDGYGDPSSVIFDCQMPAGYVLNNSDCDDSNSQINEAATEICNNGIDDDCDGLIDSADPDVGNSTTWYQDADGDGFGNIQNQIIDCSQPNGYVDNSSDCDDSNMQINPGAQEVCNSIDDDCDGLIDIEDPDISGVGLWFADLDGDGFGDENNTFQECIQPIGYVANRDDCDDSDENINPDAVEICNDIDDNCDGLIDEADPSLSGLNVLYLDSDGDGFGDANESIEACDDLQGFVSNDTDCDDTDPAINPDAVDVGGNGIDENCDGADGTVATSDLDKINFDIYPNPFYEGIYIEAEISDEMYLSLVDIMGRKVLEQKNSKLPAFLNLRELESGTYFLEIRFENSNDRVIQKVMKL